MLVATSMRSLSYDIDEENTTPSTAGTIANNVVTLVAVDSDTGTGTITGGR